MSLRAPLAAFLVVVLPSTAQQTAVTWGPELAPVGCPVYYSVVNAGPASIAFDPCGFAVYDAAGNLVFVPPCTGPVVLQAREFHAQQWNQVNSAGQPVPAGLYHLDNPGGPTVVVGGANAAVAPIGSRNFELCAPRSGGFPYLMAASLSSTTGIPFCGGTIPLDPDALLRLSLRSPGVFQGFIGVLDPTGKAAAHIAMPNNLGFFEFSLAFIVLDPAAPCGVREISAPTHTLVF